ncbi:EH signature domain-containing protein [Maritimibacter sp. DP1N21-5]|uniref:EH signature domain-containing protein n=1 Tax=Maritimibacter sp. DP1N21-5 TaxID=2836867 RepID=UPI001C46FAE5|nr:EH signature domain-containing protein [Maritimibacter sp. DP1N21-5]MBV7411123.1 hypothetical protein [Maritimibacter sp. DP1N21-5]
MRSSEFFSRPLPLNVRALPSLDPIRRSVSRVMERWPDVVALPSERNREQLALEMKRRVKDWDWDGFKTARVNSAAIAVFDAERRDRPDLDDVRTFYLDEIAACQPGAFLDAMVWVYIDSFDDKSQHTVELATALETRKGQFGPRPKQLLELFPGLLDTSKIASDIADKMMSMDAPYDGLKDLGFRSPHTAGITIAAHHKFVSRIQGSLKQEDPRARLLKWLIPAEGKPLLNGAQEAVEALVRPWLNDKPPPDVQSDLTETIIAAYNDPRLHSGGIWAGFDQALKDVLFRWLTKEDMQFFCDTITATQDSHMWPPRRDFWLRLFEEGRIRSAWVAFGTDARSYSREVLLRKGLDTSGKRFGRQMDRGGSTSLLIMQIGNKIVVDGCHSYKTHIFKKDDPMAPPPYGTMYYCDAIRLKSKLSRSHHPISSWSEWVERHV